MISKHPTLLLTRPIKAAHEFASELNLGPNVDVVFSPLIKIEYLETKHPFEAAVFSSQNGIVGVGLGRGRSAYCVGEKTADAANNAGFVVKAVEQTAEKLINEIVSNPPQTDIIHFRGEFARGKIAENLTATGITCSEQIVYLQIAQDLSRHAQSLLIGDSRLIVPLFSPRTASLFSQQALELNFLQKRAHKIEIVALSNTVANQLPTPLRENSIVPSQPTRDMMLQSVARYFRD